MVEIRSSLQPLTSNSVYLSFVQIPVQSGTRMYRANPVISEEPDEIPHTFDGPTNNSHVADQRWKQYNLLSLGTSCLLLTYINPTDPIN